MLICEDFQSQCVTAVMEVHMHWWMFHTRTIIVALDDKVWAYSHLPSTHSSSMRAIQDRTSPPCDSFGTTKLISFFCSFARTLLAVLQQENVPCGSGVRLAVLLREQVQLKADPFDRLHHAMQCKRFGVGEQSH